MPHEYCLFSSALYSLVGGNTLVHKLVNAIHYAQRPALKSVNGKSQSVIRSKFFSFYWKVFDFDLAHGLQDFKPSDLNP